MEIKEIIFTIVFSVTIISLSISTGLIWANENSIDENIVYGNQLKSAGLNKTITSFVGNYSIWENASLGQEPEDYETGKGIDILTSLIQVGQVLKIGVVSLTVLIAGLLPIPPFVYGIAIGLFIIALIIAIYKLWRGYQ